MFSLESPHRGDSNEYTQYTIFYMNKKKHPKLSQICSSGYFSKGLKNEFETAMVNEPSVFEPLKFYCSYFIFMEFSALRRMGTLTREASLSSPCLSPFNAREELTLCKCTYCFTFQICPSIIFNIKHLLSQNSSATVTVCLQPLLL